MNGTSTSPRRPVSERPVVALVVDVAAVLAFAAAGRRSHQEGLTPSGLLGTAWPFLTGLVLGWAACRAWRRPVAVLACGVPVWGCTVAVGMVLRQVTGAGTAASF